VLWDGHRTTVLLEGVEADLDAQARAAQLGPECVAPQLPAGPHRGRISVPPSRLGAVAAALDGLPGMRWLAEAGVGTVHVASDDPSALAGARDAAHHCDGWLLREAGGPDGFGGFGLPLPNAELHARIKDAFDPSGKFNPGRLT
jgi:hypothetical protein